MTCATARDGPPVAHGLVIMKFSFAAVAVLAALATAPTLTACTDGEPTIDDGSVTEEISARARFDLWKDGSAFVFAFVSAQGETLLDSQDYASRTAALSGLVSVLDNGTQAARYTVVVAANGSAYFQLRASNSQVIATSGTYATKAAADKAVTASVASLVSYPKHWVGGTGARFEVRADAGGKYGFYLYAGNGALVLRSERYESLGAALNGAFSVADNGTNTARYQVVNSAAGGFYLNLTATNGQIIGTSEVYTSKTNATRARDQIVALLPRISVL